MRPAPFARWMPAALALAGLAPIAGAAHAQVFGPVLDTEIPFDLSDPERPTVLERPRPEIAPLGIDAGGFLVFPEVEVTPGYTSNVYGAAKARTDNAFVIVNPLVEARSRWSRNMLNAHAEGTFRRYLSNALRNQDGYNTFLEGRLDLAGGSNLYGQARADRIYIEQYSGDFPANAASSVPLNRQSAILRGTYQGGKLRLIGNADVNRLDYQSAQTIDGRPIDQDFRDETVWRAGARAEYRLGPARVLFVQATHAVHDYVNRTAQQLDRSGTETRLLGGISFYPTPLIRTRIAVGYLWRKYDDPTVADLKGLAIDVQADYSITKLTTISLAVRREAQDAVLSNSPGYLVTRFQGRIDHEYLRNLLLHAQVDVERDDFLAIDRNDTLYRLEAGATYTPFRRIVVDPIAQFIKRESAGGAPGQRFDELRVLFRTTLRY